jgi:hypothetical protein
MIGPEIKEKQVAAEDKLWIAKRNFSEVSGTYKDLRNEMQSMSKMPTTQYLPGQTSNSVKKTAQVSTLQTSSAKHFLLT